MKVFKKKVNDKSVVILPIGAVEGHGEHLPLGTDSFQAEYVAEQVSKATGAFITPPIWYGVCATTRNFPGTLSISFQSLQSIVRDILFELVRNGFRNIVVLSGHAGSAHMTALQLAAKDVVDHRNVRVLVLSDYDLAYELRGKLFSENDGHAGTIETSRMMAIKPRLVMGAGKKGENTIPRFLVVRNPEKYWGGVTGDPKRASIGNGRKINHYIVKRLIDLIEELNKST